MSIESVNASKRGRAITPPLEEDSRHTYTPSKKQRLGKELGHEQTGKSGEPASRSLLLELPVELLHAIHVYAKNPALAIVNRSIKRVFNECPLSVKVQYLLARWHEAYCYGFHPLAASREADFSSKDGMIKRNIDVQGSFTSRSSSPALPSRPSSDLLDGGALPELQWTSRFIPVLPVNEFPYPLSNSFQRSADHYVLDYCLRYPITTFEVLHAVEARILKLPEFGNIVLATGLWCDDENVLHVHEPRRRPVIRNSDEDGRAGSDSEDDEIANIVMHPTRLRVTELPKRLFHGFGMTSKNGVLDSQKQSREARLTSALKQHLRVFGDGPLPNDASLMILLSVASLHIPTAPLVPAGAAPFNSFEGLPLAKATFAQSMCMVQLLLALGAEPSRKGSLSLYVAVRAGWLDGLVALVEREEGKILDWYRALKAIRRCFYDLQYEQAESDGRDATFNGFREVFRDGQEERDSSSDSSRDRLHTATANGNQTAGSANQSKRRRLHDRVGLDHRVLKEAVKYARWPVANWLRGKGVMPDLRTVKLLEMKQHSQPPPPPSSSS